MNSKMISIDTIYLHKAHDFCKSNSPILTVILLHGIASDATTFNTLLETLEVQPKYKDIRFIAYDLLGSGHSPKVDDELDYGADEQIVALDNSIKLANINTPIILLGHSMGTIIASRYADAHRRTIDELILVSPPLYCPEDFNNPLFEKGQEAFREIVTHKSPHLQQDKAFNNMLKNIVLTPQHFKVLSKLDKPTTIIYGELDQIIAPFNIPKLLTINPSVTATKTNGRHGVTKDKFPKIMSTLDDKLSHIASLNDLASTMENAK